MKSQTRRAESGSAIAGSASATSSAAASVVDEEEEQAKLTNAQRQQVHFNAVLENIEVSEYVIMMSEF